MILDFYSFKKRIAQLLQTQYSTNELSSITAYLAEFYLQKKHSLLSEINFDEKDLLQKINALQEKQPIQQIVGFAYFGEEKFYVNQNVLIPRPETYELVEKIIFQSKNKPIQHILDIGTGSGCIAICLAAHFTEAQIEGIDVSAEALAVAIQNNIQFKTKVQFFQRDIFEWHDSQIKYDIIVSNPPYIDPSEAGTMDKTVVDFEPHLALFSENDVLAFYKKISLFAQKNLTPNGTLYFEIHSDKKVEVCQIMLDCGFQKIECYQDFYGMDRIIMGKI